MPLGKSWLLVAIIPMCVFNLYVVQGLEQKKNTTLLALFAVT